MTLGAQCWGCKWRRVRCDSHFPCSKCTQKGLQCPGFSTTAPLKWRHRLTRTQPVLTVSTRVPNYSPMLRKDVAPAEIVFEVITYCTSAPCSVYITPVTIGQVMWDSTVLKLMPSGCIVNDKADNARIAPDVSASGASDFFIKATEWIAMDDIARHLYICVVALHKIIRKDRPESTDKVLFHHHQACAAKILQERITQAKNAGPDPKILEAMSMFLCSQIQGSAYGTWRAHISGAKAILEKWGFRSLLGRCDFPYYVLLMTDIYGTTMAPSALLSLESVEQHLLYLDMFERLQVDTWSTITPIPTDIIKATVRINICRISAVARLDVPYDTVDPQDMSPNFIMSTLREFDPLIWASSLPPHALAEHDSWITLAACFQYATMLYLLISCKAATTNTPPPELSEGTRSHIYRELVAGIHDLFKRKRHGGTHYKFIFWAMVICGVEAAAKKDRIELQFLCDALQTTTLDLGALAMREAAEFLLEVWNHCEQRHAKSQSVDIVWDTVFERAPVFLM